MRKAILPLIAIMLLLLVISVTLSKSDPSQTIEMNGGTETSEKGFEIAETEATQESHVATESVEVIAQASQNPNEQFLPEEENQQSTSTNEEIQTLQKPTQRENIAPPDGRIYYPTSSEKPYAYTPTQTPKETNIPITPLYPEN